MPVDTQVSSSNSPRAATRTPRTGTPSVSPSRYRSFRTHSATATWSTPAPLGAVWTTPPPSLHTCGPSQPSPAGARNVPAESVTGKSSVVVLAIDGLPAAGLLADLPREVQTLEGELDGAGPLAVVPGIEPVTHLVVEVGLAEDRKAHQEVTGRDLPAGGDHLAGLDPVDEQGEVDAAEVPTDRLRRRTSAT